MLSDKDLSVIRGIVLSNLTIYEMNKEFYNPFMVTEMIMSQIAAMLGQK